MSKIFILNGRVKSLFVKGFESFPSFAFTLQPKNGVSLTGQIQCQITAFWPLRWLACSKQSLGNCPTWSPFKWRLVCSLKNLGFQLWRKLSTQGRLNSNGFWGLWSGGPTEKKLPRPGLALKWETVGVKYGSLISQRKCKRLCKAFF